MDILIWFFLLNCSKEELWGVEILIEVFMWFVIRLWKDFLWLSSKSISVSVLVKSKILPIKTKGAHFGTCVGYYWIIFSSTCRKSPLCIDNWSDWLWHIGEPVIWGDRIIYKAINNSHDSVSHPIHILTTTSDWLPAQVSRLQGCGGERNLNEYLCRSMLLQL